jgi:hypothetical protein
MASDMEVRRAFASMLSRTSSSIRPPPAPGSRPRRGVVAADRAPEVALLLLYVERREVDHVRALRTVKSRRGRGCSPPPRRPRSRCSSPSTGAAAVKPGTCRARLLGQPPRGGEGAAEDPSSSVKGAIVISPSSASPGKLRHPRHRVHRLLRGQAELALLAGGVHLHQRAHRRARRHRRRRERLRQPHRVERVDQVASATARAALLRCRWPIRCQRTASRPTSATFSVQLLHPVLPQVAEPRGDRGAHGLHGVRLGDRHERHLARVPRAQRGPARSAPAPPPPARRSSARPWPDHIPRREARQQAPVPGLSGGGASAGGRPGAGGPPPASPGARRRPGCGRAAPRGRG